MSIFKPENLLSLAVTIFGIITLIASSSTLFDYSNILEKEGNYPFFILWINPLTSPLFLLVAVGFKHSKKWTLHLLLVILIIFAGDLTSFILLIKNGGVYETETLVALSIRIAFASMLTFFALNEIPRSELRGIKWSLLRKPISFRPKGRGINHIMNKEMKTTIKTLLALLGIFIFGSSMAQAIPENLYSIVIEVDNFRNAKGVAHFALYNQDGTMHDEN